MSLTAEQIQSNWKVFLHNIEKHISDNKDRKQKLLNFYKKYEERIILMPAAHKKEYHNAFPGGYVDHVNRVVQASIALNELWTTFGADMTTYTKEELIFSAINHDLGKMGDSENEAYVPQTDQWRKEKLLIKLNNVMKYRDSINQQIELLEGKVRDCQRLVQTQEPISTYRKTIGDALDLIENIKSYIEQEPRDGYEQNSSVRR